jgi:hypothetical protein
VRWASQKARASLIASAMARPGTEQISPQPLRLNVDLDKPRATRALVAALERNLARATEPALRGRLAGVIRPTARGAIMSAADHFDTGSKKIRGMARRSLDLDHDRGGAALASTICAR